MPVEVVVEVLDFPAPPEVVVVPLDLPAPAEVDVLVLDLDPPVDVVVLPLDFAAGATWVVVRGVGLVFPDPAFVECAPDV